MSLWRRGSLTTNPYLRTAFRVIKAPREATRTVTLAQLAGQAKHIAASNPQARSILGEPVTLEEINKAESIILDPQRRILEELLVHTTERIPMKRMRQLAQAAAKAMAVDGDSMPPPSNMAGLVSWMDDLVREYQAKLEPSSPLLGAAEMTLVPPFGKIRKD